VNEMDDWSELFVKSSFFALKKGNDLSGELKELQARIVHSDKINSFHINRKNEFVLGRICASKAHEICTRQELLSLPANGDRSPLWPTEVVGSISHDQFWVGAAVAKKTDLLGVGIDFEVMGRTRVELASHIRSSGDMKKHPDLTDEELLTLIFSCKESLYKALYPTVKKFFGFEEAALRLIDLNTGVFMIDLLSQLTPDFGPSSHHIFSGRFKISSKNCLTVLEIATFPNLR
jgi:4'-phosphopantetheinyl transferase EntD